MRHSLRALLCVLGVHACASTTPQTPVPPVSGYMLTGPGVKYFGLNVHDSIPEVVGSIVPALVSAAAAKDAQGNGFDSTCSRFFRKADTFIVIFVTRCRRGLVVDDGQGMGAYDLKGRALGQALLEVRTEFDSLVPFRRDQ